MNFKENQIVVFIDERTSNSLVIIGKITTPTLTESLLTIETIKTIRAYHPDEYRHKGYVLVARKHEIKPFKYKCEKCGKKISPENAHFNEDKIVCKDCAYKRKCSVCEKTIIGEVVFSDVYSDTICEHCYDEYYTTCIECRSVILRDDAIIYNGGIYCNECAPDDDNGDEFFKATDSIATENDDNTFGLELEVINPNKYDFKYDCDYNTRKYFNAVPDASLSCDGVEYTTSIMKFSRKSYKIIKQFVNALKDSGAYADESCGYHVHIGIQKLAETDFGKVKLANKILIAYLNLQNLFFEIHKDRKNSKYCMPLNKDEVYDLIKSETVVEWFKKFYNSSRPIIEKYYDKRYEWVNVHSMFYQNTVEIRLHGGTLNYKDIFYWLQINRKIIYHLAKHNLDYAKKFNAQKLHKILNKNEQAYLLKKLIGENNEHNRIYKELWTAV